MVSGHLSYTTGMSEILSDMLKSAYMSLDNKVGVISTDDLLSRLQDLEVQMEKEDIKIRHRKEG